MGDKLQLLNISETCLFFFFFFLIAQKERCSKLKDFQCTGAKRESASVETAELSIW